MYEKKTMITYIEKKNFTVLEIERLFLSVHWDSGKYPKKVVEGLQNSSVVFAAYDQDRLVGLVRGLDDGCTVGFIHYLLVDIEYQGKHIGDSLMKLIMERYSNLLQVKVMPSDRSVIPFYERYGFKQYDHYSALELSRL